MRPIRWISLSAGATLFGVACNPDLQMIASQGTASLLTSIANSLIENFINSAFNLPNLGNFNF